MTLDGEKIAYTFLRETEKKILDDIKHNEMTLCEFLELQEDYIAELEQAISNLKDEQYNMRIAMQQADNLVRSAPLRYSDIKKD